MVCEPIPIIVRPTRLWVVSVRNRFHFLAHYVPVIAVVNKLHQVLYLKQQASCFDNSSPEPKFCPKSHFARLLRQFTCQQPMTCVVIFMNGEALGTSGTVGRSHSRFRFVCPGGRGSILHCFLDDAFSSWKRSVIHLKYRSNISEQPVNMARTVSMFEVLIWHLNLWG
jgi:hypothetical protein